MSSSGAGRIQQGDSRGKEAVPMSNSLGLQAPESSSGRKKLEKSVGWMRKVLVNVVCPA